MQSLAQAVGQKGLRIESVRNLDYQHGRNLLIVVPSELYTGELEKVCLMMSEMQGPLTVNVTLTYEKEAVILVEQQVEDVPQCLCLKFTVPQADRVIGIFNVECRTLDFKFNDSKLVWIERLPFQTFVQSDKLLYKPGQTVKFRIVTLDADFQIVNQTVGMLCFWLSALRASLIATCHI
ncbi:hypothetical protein scyTo_0010986 [Scyliorhinus torazame]|uniref:Macroglobulin domain-containing protein n=1 Tax=Scyliorhinus torazame TaxID=75743 RepID=A0A401NFS5_SCYTO|nr:hypothetical protein [Scyliorhinus torazame]